GDPAVFGTDQRPCGAGFIPADGGGSAAGVRDSRSAGRRKAGPTRVSPHGSGRSKNLWGRVYPGRRRWERRWGAGFSLRWPASSRPYKGEPAWFGQTKEPVRPGLSRPTAMGAPLGRGFLAALAG